MPKSRQPLLVQIYQQFLVDQDAAAMIARVEARYDVSTLERLALAGGRMARRAAVLALGHVGPFSSNQVLGRALSDSDRGVRTLADTAIRMVWCRAESDDDCRRLAIVMRLNSTHRHVEAVRRADQLIEQAPALAEAWNQRAIALFNMGRFAESITDCRQALELNPYHFGAASGMGQCYLQLKEHSSALECFRRALRLNPGLEGIRAQANVLLRTLQGREHDGPSGE